MIKYETLSQEEKDLLHRAIHQQAWLEAKADIDYQCYYLKIDKQAFWEKYLDLDGVRVG